jgi:hypothetical protein
MWTVNPFAPVMLSNGAGAVEEFARDHPRQHLALMMRPCELRALSELRKRDRKLLPSPDPDHSDFPPVIVCVDCPGTFPPEDYARRISAHDSDAR